MLIVVVFFSLCFVHGCVSKPTTGNDLTEGRGVMSSIWEWIKYPFFWWSAGKPELPMTEQLIGSATIDPIDIVDIRSHNVTIWCNDQTCTTMKCDKIDCRNISCNLYDTNFRGECREYNILSGPEEFTVPLKTNVTIQRETTDAPSKTSSESELLVFTSKQEQPDNNQTSDGQALELEAVLSSSVDERYLKNLVYKKKYDSIHELKDALTTILYGRNPSILSCAICSVQESKSMHPPKRRPLIRLIKTRNGARYSFLKEINRSLNKILQPVLVHYATILINIELKDLKVESFCSDGLCYYSRCENGNCKLRYCKFNIFTNKEKCTILSEVNKMIWVKSYSNTN